MGCEERGIDQPWHTDGKMDLKRIISAAVPGLVARHLIKRAALANAQRLYKAAQATQYHPHRGDNRSGNSVMEHARGRIAEWGRYLDENSDLAVGVFNDLQDNIVGSGINVEPMIRLPSGELAVDQNASVRRLWELWGRKPEASQVIPWGEVQRLACRSWLRDGDLFCQLVINSRSYQYPTVVPFGLELLESDMVPFDLTMSQIRNGDDSRIIHGIEHDGWNRVKAYHVYLRHPNEFIGPLTAAGLLGETKAVPAERMLHLKFVRRVNQARGVPIMHASTHRLSDLEDYEESERLAAKVAASLTAFIRKSPDLPGQFDTTNSANADRSMTMQSAMIFDNLMPGEEVQTIESKRPNNVLGEYRNAMLRAVSAGTGAKASSISRHYEGTYSSQRQELVEAKPGYDRLREYFVAQFVRPIYEMFLLTSQLSGAVDLSGIDTQTLRDARYLGPGMPWINPKDEINADSKAVSAGFKSRHQVIRERGGDPVQVDMERESDESAPKAPQEDTKGIANAG